MFFQYSNGNKTDENQQSSTSSGSQQPPRKAKCKKKEDSETSAATAGSAGGSGSTKNEDLKPPDDTIETLEEFYDKVEVKVKIPDKLKPYLVDDWDYLTRQVSFISVSIFFFEKIWEIALSKLSPAMI